MYSNGKMENNELKVAYPVTLNILLYSFVNLSGICRADLHEQNNSLVPTRQITDRFRYGYSIPKYA